MFKMNQVVYLKHGFVYLCFTSVVFLNKRDIGLGMTGQKISPAYNPKLVYVLGQVFVSLGTFLVIDQFVSKVLSS